MEEKSTTEELSKEEEVRMIAAIFPNDTRKAIIRLLLGETEPVKMYHNEICEAMGGSKSTVHKHLTALTEIEGILNTKPGFKSSSEKQLVKFYYIKEKYARALRNYIDLL